MMKINIYQKYFQYLFAIFAIFLISSLTASDILLEHPVKCGQLQCFPSSQNSNEYYYLPSNPHVALNENGQHEFSFTRYVKANPSDSGEGGIIDADGGGIVHFLVDYTITDKQLSAAKAALQELNQDALITGPIIFEAGNFALVSSFAPVDDEPNELTKKVIGVGRAPLIEGLKAAVSMHLTKEGSQILWRSFQMDTPDVSIVFEMTFSGLNDPANATIKADWQKLQDQADTSIDTKVSYLGIGGGFDYSNFWQEAKDTGAITVDYKGDPDKLQAIIDRTYTKLHDMMFEPIGVSQANPADDGDPLESMLAVSRNLGNKASANYSAPWEVKINAGYKRRKMSQKGIYTFNFNQQSKGTITTAMAGNIGSLHRLYGDNPAVFRTINLSESEFKTREISVALDARDEKEFAKYINHVTLTVKKEHGSGRETVGEVVIKRSNFESGKPQVISYNWEDEPDVEKWMTYQYKVDWSFLGGASYSSDWQEGNSAALSLTPPYQYREVKFVASPNILQESDVRNVSIRVSHDFFGRSNKETLNLTPSENKFNEVRVFAVPPENDSIEYFITWTLNNREKITSGKQTTNETIIFCDELPN